MNKQTQTSKGAKWPADTAEPQPLQTPLTGQGEEQGSYALIYFYF